MRNAGTVRGGYGLGEHGIRNLSIAHWNLGTAQLLTQAMRRDEGVLAQGGAFVVTRDSSRADP